MPARSRRWRRLVRPHVAIITTVEPVHLEHFRSVEAIADAKAEIFAGRGAGRRRGPQSRQSAFTRACRRHAKAAGVARIVTFGEHAKADARLIKCALQPDSSTVQASILGSDVSLQARRAGPPSRR